MNAARAGTKAQKTRADQNLIAVFGCAGLRDRSKRSVMTQSAVELADLVVLTEGIWDCEKVMQAGYPAVASFGCHLSDIQLGKLLSKYPVCTYIMYDGDQAGLDGAIAAYRKIIKRCSTPVQIIRIPDEKDPCDLKEAGIRWLIKGEGGGRCYVQHTGDKK